MPLESKSKRFEDSMDSSYLSRIQYFSDYLNMKITIMEDKAMGEIPEKEEKLIKSKIELLKELEDELFEIFPEIYKIE